MIYLSLCTCVGRAGEPCENDGIDRELFSGDDVWIFQRALDQHYVWPASETGGCHVKFSQ